MPVLIGTSGYQYRHWLDAFYPRRPRVADDLAFYAASTARRSALQTVAHG